MPVPPITTLATRYATSEKRETFFIHLYTDGSGVSPDYPNPKCGTTLVHGRLHASSFPFTKSIIVVDMRLTQLDLFSRSLAIPLQPHDA
jgi:hypothetical protein